MNQEIKISEVLTILNTGGGREGVKAHFNLDDKGMKALFKHPKLKNKRGIKPVTFSIVDDTKEKSPAVSQANPATEAVPETSTYGVYEETPQVEEVRTEESSAQASW